MAAVLLLCHSAGLLADSLRYEVKGVRGELATNIEGWLGEMPQTEAERVSFLATLDTRVAQSLEALGYYQPRILTTLTKSEPTWHLRLTIEAKEPVRINNVSILIAGAAADDPSFTQRLKDVDFAYGDVLHHGKYDRFKQSLLRLGQQRGYFDAEIILSRVEVSPDVGVASIRLHYSSGPRYRFGNLLFDSEQMTRGQLDALRGFQEGDAFDLERLQAFQTALQQTRYFSSVIVRPQVALAKNAVVPIQLLLHAAKRHSFDVGLGYSTDIEQRASFTWRTPKINRWGHSQETRLEYSSVRPSGRFNYNIPFSHPLNDVLQLSARVGNNEYGDLDSHQREISARREIRHSNGWIRSYSVRGLEEDWDLKNADFYNQYLLPGFTLSHKTRSGLLVDPTSGFSQFYQFEGGSAELGSDIDLLRAYSRFTSITQLAEQHRRVVRAELGAVWVDEKDRGELAPSLNFFAGGGASVRGFAYQSLGNEVEVVGADGVERTLVVGGERLFTSSVEYQYYFNKTWRGAIFGDLGDAFDEGDFEANYSLGLGFHYMTPVGAVKIEFANSLSEDRPSWRLHLNVGAEF